TCTSCPADCGPCPNCTASWYCKDAKTRAYRSATCQVTYFVCGDYFCCKNGQCIKDLRNTCRDVVIDYAYAEANLAQMQGPNEGLGMLAVVSLVTLVGIVLYAFIKVETHL
ncbi:MAG: hypothetical protein ABIF01_05060, partial [Candidatus Micrarchaeota archaeon]